MSSWINKMHQIGANNTTEYREVFIESPMEGRKLRVRSGFVNLLRSFNEGLHKFC